MKSSSRAPYVVLLFYVLASAGYLVINFAQLIDGFWLKHARTPFQIDFRTLQLSDIKDEAKNAGVKEGDRIESLTGETYSGESHWVRLARHKPAGTVLRIGVRHTDASVHEGSITLREEEKDDDPFSGSTLFFFIILGGPIPLVCLLIGY